MRPRAWTTSLLLASCTATSRLGCGGGGRHRGEGSAACLPSFLGLLVLACTGCFPVATPSPSLRAVPQAANVLLSAAGWTKRGWQAKIADLGLSRMLPPDAVRSLHEPPQLCMPCAWGRHQPRCPAACHRSTWLPAC